MGKKKKSTVGEGQNFNQASALLTTEHRNNHRQQLLATAKRVGRNPRDMAERGSCKDGVENLAEVLLGSKNMQEMLIR